VWRDDDLGKWVHVRRLSFSWVVVEVAVKRRIRTVRQIADAVGCDIERATELLNELEEMGLAERCIGGWRMTEWAEKRYGRALRDMDDEEAAA
jgi:DNA-binding IclR family transcriptional regulator